MEMRTWSRLDDTARKWVLWSLTAIGVFVVGLYDHDIWGLGIIGLFLWAVADY